MSIGAIASGLSGLRAAQLSLDTSAHNVANANTAGFRPQTVQNQESSGGGVNSTVVQTDSDTGADLATETVNSLVYKHNFSANAKIIQTADQNLGTLINIKA